MPPPPKCYVSVAKAIKYHHAPQIFGFDLQDPKENLCHKVCSQHCHFPLNPLRGQAGFHSQFNCSSRITLTPQNIGSFWFLACILASLPLPLPLLLLPSPFLFRIFSQLSYVCSSSLPSPPCPADQPPTNPLPPPSHPVQAHP